MTTALIAPGRVMLRGPSAAVLCAPLGVRAAVVPPASGGSPSTIAGLSGWWDASGIAGLLNPAGAAVISTGGAVGSVIDKSGGGNALTVYHQASSGSVAPVATPRLNGLLGGLGRNTVIPPNLPATGQYLPAMDPDQGLSLAAPVQWGSATPWTLFLVWSRPNWRQGYAGLTALVTIAGKVVLGMDAVAGPARLILFPGVSQIILNTTNPRRHSHAVIIRNTPGTGLAVWLDGTAVAPAVTNPLAASYSGTLLLLHDGTSGGGAQCWFHEAATWSTALAAGDITTLLGYAARWQQGARKGVQILVSGQSNAGNALNDGAWHLLAQGVAWHLGALAYGVVGTYSGPPSATCIGGQGIYPIPAAGFAGAFLTNPGDGSSPSGWALGADGLAVQTFLAATPATDTADIAALFWPWSESDSARLYSEKAVYSAAVQRLLALERTMLLRSAATLPHLWWSAIPFPDGSNDPGVQMVREVAAEQAANSGQNCTIILPQTCDSLPRGPTYNALTGAWTGGDNWHRDATDNLRFGQTGAALAARAILAASGGDSLGVIPAGIPAVGGPFISHVWRQSGTVLIVTITHDCGTDLIVPPTLAASGSGWAVMDGGSLASPGTIRLATACARVDATHLQVTLASGLINASSACRLFYPYGSGQYPTYTGIGRGDAVTDNYATVAKPAGWDIGADLGSAWAINLPVAAPVSLTAGVATSGCVLSDVTG
jgi:hypothetical protein